MKPDQQWQKWLWQSNDNKQEVENKWVRDPETG